MLTDEQSQAIFHSEHCNISKDLAGVLCRAIEAAVLEAQGKQEPVAWMHWYKYYDGTDVVKVAIGHAPTFNDQSPFRSEPLFAAPVVQPDMVMVPREATPEMVSAGYSKITMEIENSSRDISDVYRAMIAAAEGKK